MNPPDTNAENLSAVPQQPRPHASPSGFLSFAARNWLVFGLLLVGMLGIGASLCVLIPDYLAAHRHHGESGASHDPNTAPEEGRGVFAFVQAIFRVQPLVILLSALLCGFGLLLCRRALMADKLLDEHGMATHVIHEVGMALVVSFCVGFTIETTIHVYNEKRQTRESAAHRNKVETLVTVRDDVLKIFGSEEVRATSTSLFKGWDAGKLKAFVDSTKNVRDSFGATERNKQRLIVLDEWESVASDLLGVKLCERGETKAALDYFQSAEAIDKKHRLDGEKGRYYPFALHRTASCLIKLGKPAEAEAKLQLARTEAEKIKNERERSNMDTTSIDGDLDSIELLLAGLARKKSIVLDQKTHTVEHEVDLTNDDVEITPDYARNKTRARASFVELNLSARKKYVIELSSNDTKMDPYLVANSIVGSTRRSDDFNLKNLDSRIVLQPECDGPWWLIATTSPYASKKSRIRTGKLKLRISAPEAIKDSVEATKQAKKEYAEFFAKMKFDFDLQFRPDDAIYELRLERDDWVPTDFANRLLRSFENSLKGAPFAELKKESKETDGKTTYRLFFRAPSLIREELDAVCTNLGKTVRDIHADLSSN